MTSMKKEYISADKKRVLTYQVIMTIFSTFIAYLIIASKSIVLPIIVLPIIGVYLLGIYKKWKLSWWVGFLFICFFTFGNFGALLFEVFSSRIDSYTIFWNSIGIILFAVIIKLSWSIKPAYLSQK